MSRSTQWGTTSLEGKRPSKNEMCRQLSRSVILVIAVVLFGVGGGFALHRNAIPPSVNQAIAGLSSVLVVGLLAFLSWLGLRQKIQGTVQNVLSGLLGTTLGWAVLVALILGSGVWMAIAGCLSQWITFKCNEDGITITFEPNLNVACNGAIFVPSGTKMVAVKPGFVELRSDDVLKTASNSTVSVSLEPIEQWGCVVGKAHQFDSTGDSQSFIKGKVGPAEFEWQQCNDWPLTLVGYRGTGRDRAPEGTGAVIVATRAESSNVVLGVWLHSDNSEKCDPELPRPQERKRPDEHRLRVKEGCAERRGSNTIIRQVRALVCTRQEPVRFTESVKLAIQTAESKDPFVLKCQEETRDEPSSISIQ